MQPIIDAVKFASATLCLHVGDLTLFSRKVYLGGLGDMLEKS